MISNGTTFLNLAQLLRGIVTWTLRVHVQVLYLYIWSFLREPVPPRRGWSMSYDNAARDHRADLGERRRTLTAVLPICARKRGKNNVPTLEA